MKELPKITVKDIIGKTRRVRLEEVTIHYEKARGITYWHKNRRLVPTEEQKQIIHQAVKEVEVFDGYRTVRKNKAGGFPSL
jgi:hypothetical protein